MYDLFTQALAHPRAIARERVTEHAQHIVEDRYPDTRQAIIATLVEHESENMVTGFLHTLVGAMRWKLKSPEVSLTTEQRQA